MSSSGIHGAAASQNTADARCYVYHQLCWCTALRALLQACKNTCEWAPSPRGLLMEEVLFTLEFLVF